MNTIASIIVSLLLVTAVTLGLYAMVYGRLSVTKFSLLSALRLMVLWLLIWLITGPMITLKNAKTITNEYFMIIDTSRSMTIRDQGTPPASRIDAVNTFLFSDYGVIEQMIKKHIPVHILSAGETIFMETPNPLSADKISSNLINSISDFNEKYRKATPSEIFLISDGQSSEPVSVLEAEPGVVINTVAMGSPQTQPDVWIESVETKKYVEAEKPFDITITIGKQDMPPDKTVRLILSDDSGIILHDQAYTNTSSHILLTVTPQKNGLHTYTVKTIIEDFDEIFTENNTRSFAVMVQKSSIKIGVVLSPSMDAASVIRALRNLRNGEIKVFNYVKKDTPDVFFSPPDAQHYTATDMITQLSDRDVIIFCDIPLEPFSQNDVLHLKELVRHGSGLFVIGGPKTLGAISNNATLLADIVPPHIMPNNFYPIKTTVLIPMNKQSHPVLARFAGIVDIKNMPPLTSLNISHAVKPGAEILLETQTVTSEPYPLLSVMRVERGKTAVFAGRGFYRWNMEQPSEHADTSALNMLITDCIAWLAASEDDALMHINLPRINYEPGEKVSLEALVLDRTYSPADNGQVNGIVSGSHGEKIVLDFVPVPGEAATWRATYLPPAPGKYHIEIKGIRAQNDVSTAHTDIVVHETTAEFKSLSPDWDFLKSLAEATGGKFYTFDQFSQYIASVKPSTTTESYSITKMIIDYPFVLIILLGCLITEWIIRIREGLA